MIYILDAWQFSSIFLFSSDHWRKNISVLAKSNRVFSIDLIGYGYSDKPNPKEVGVSSFYTFETWAEQLNDFCADVVKDKAFFICNSIGGETHDFSIWNEHSPILLLLCFKKFPAVCVKILGSDLLYNLY